MTSKDKGNIGLGRAIQYFTSKGYTVLLPLNDAQDYDLAFDAGDGIKTVQVKYTTQRASNGSSIAKLYTCGHRDANGSSYEKLPDYSKIDYYWFSNDTGEDWLIPISGLVKLKTVTLNSTKEQYKI